MMNRLDIVLFGATGFTGRVTIPTLAKLAKNGGKNITWGIAGRSFDKLKQVLEEASANIGDDLSSIPIIVANTNDEQSMDSMASQAKIILNMAGPYRFFGESVVKACIRNGAHQLDISGEPQFMEEMELKYNKEAKKKNVFIISSCGYDSIPADLGAQFLVDNYDGVFDSIEGYMNVKSEVKKKGSSYNYATWVSAVNGVQHYKDLVNIRKQLAGNRKPLPKDSKLKNVSKNPITGQWVVPFPGADKSVMQRSQQYFYEHFNRKPIKVMMYMSLDSMSSLIGSIFIFSSLMVLANKKFGRDLLLKYPGFFTFGTITRENPDVKECERTNYTLYLQGRGWPQSKLQNSDATDSKNVVLGKITGTDPGYGGTAMVAVTTAITLLEEMENMPKIGGVYTPAAAFVNTTLVSRLNSNGLKFEIVSKI